MRQRFLGHQNVRLKFSSTKSFLARSLNKCSE